MSSIASDEQTGFGGLSAFQNPIVCFIGRNRKTPLRSDHHSNFFNGFQQDFDAIGMPRKLGTDEDLMVSFNTSRERHNVNEPSNASSTMVAEVPCGVRQAATTMLLSRTTRTI